MNSIDGTCANFQAGSTQDNKQVDPKTTQKLQDKDLISLGEYNKILSSKLPKELFLMNPKRIAWLFFYLGANAALIYSLLNLNLHWSAKIIVSILIGNFSAGGALLAHEIMHGSIIKNRKIQDICGFFLMTPFLVPPTYWRFWHNKLHHGNTQMIGKDPDAFPTRLVWKKSKFMKAIFPLTPGSKNPISFLYFFYWFPFQSIMNVLYFRFNTKMWGKMNHTKVSLEFILQVAIMSTYVYFIGLSDPLFLIILPFMIQNYIVMSYISTNHNISPYTNINDPLANSLTVTNPKIFEFFHLNFGYHTEHHIFPKMPMNNAKIVSDKLKELYPERYHIMPKYKALYELYKTPRLYKNKTTLVHPKTQKEYKTLGSR